MTNDSEKAPVDFSYLEEYTGGDAEVIAELLEVCKETAKEGIGILKENVNSDDLTQWSAAAHKLKGAAGYVGAFKLKELCASAQTMELPAASVEARQNLYEDILEAYEEIVDYLEGHSL